LWFLLYSSLSSLSYLPPQEAPISLPDLVQISDIYSLKLKQPQLTYRNTRPLEVLLSVMVTIQDPEFSSCPYLAASLCHSKRAYLPALFQRESKSLLKLFLHMSPFLSLPSFLFLFNFDIRCSSYSIYLLFYFYFLLLPYISYVLHFTF
jgi:hypothetical protein